MIIMCLLKFASTQKNVDSDSLRHLTKESSNFIFFCMTSFATASLAELFTVPNGTQK
jgi:hypothetical protein